MTFKQLTVLTGNSVSHLNDVMSFLGAEGVNSVGIDAIIREPRHRSAEH